MLKRNTYGLLRRCKELWIKLLDWISINSCKRLITSPSKELLDESVNYSGVSTIEEIRNLNIFFDSIVVFFEGYIGEVVVSIEIHRNEDISSFPAEIIPSVISGVSIDGGYLSIMLSSIRGIDIGWIMIPINRDVKFLEIDTCNSSLSESKFRIGFLNSISVLTVDSSSNDNVIFKRVS